MRDEPRKKEINQYSERHFYIPPPLTTSAWSRRHFQFWFSFSKHWQYFFFKKCMVYLQFVLSQICCKASPPPSLLSSCFFLIIVTWAKIQDKGGGNKEFLLQLNSPVTSDRVTTLPYNFRSWLTKIHRLTDSFFIIPWASGFRWRRFFLVKSLAVKRMLCGEKKKKAKPNLRFSVWSAVVAGSRKKKLKSKHTRRPHTGRELHSA